MGNRTMRAASALDLVTIERFDGSQNFAVFRCGCLKICCCLGIHLADKLVFRMLVASAVESDRRKRHHIGITGSGKKVVESFNVTREIQKFIRVSRVNPRR